MWLDLRTSTIWVQKIAILFSINFLHHNITNATKSFSPLQNLMGFLLQFTEMDCYIQNWAKIQLGVICAHMVDFTGPVMYAKILINWYIAIPHVASCDLQRYTALIFRDTLRWSCISCLMLILYEKQHLACNMLCLSHNKPLML